MGDENFYASLTGWLSVVCWIVVFTPQIWENFHNKSGESLSLWFLWIWLIGDVFNIAGAAMNNLLETMLVLAIYYTIADAILIIQVFYYRHLNRKEVLQGEFDRLVESAQNPTNASSSENEKIQGCFFSNHKIITLQVISAVTVFASYVIIERYGVAEYLGWCSAILYIGSRIPQILKNTKNKSTTGLSSYMFIFSIAGNALYCASILLQSSEKEYILLNLPWLVGSMGTLALDVVIGGQLIAYRQSVMEA